MKSTFGGLNTIIRGLYAQQASLDTVGHNVANANTDGYSRQRVNLITTTPETLYGSNGPMQSGTGVSVESILRLRDSFIDRQYWQENSALGYSNTVSDMMTKIQGVFHEPSDTGVQTTLNNFWTAWDNLANNASDNGVRSALRQRGQEVVDSIHKSADQLKNMVNDLNQVVDIDISKINQINDEIFSLNRQISNIETGHMDNANDLRDRRDYLVDQLSNFLDVRVTEDQYGNYNVQTSGTTLVSGQDVQHLKSVKASDSEYGYETRQIVLDQPGPPVTLTFNSGELKAIVDIRDDTTFGAKGYLNKLSTISQFLLKDFNEIHRQGLGTDNTTNNNFFGNPNETYTDTATVTTYTDPYNWPARWPTTAIGNPPTGGQWLDALKVNPILFDQAHGLEKIAAKGYVGQITQSNVYSGKMTATADGVYTPTTTLSNIQVKIDAVDGNNDVSSIKISTDGGSTWSASLPGTAVAGGTPPYKFDIAHTALTGTTDIGLNFHFTFANSSKNTAGDTYSFSVPQGNAAGDNAVLIGNRLKTDSTTGFNTLGNSSLDTYYNAMTGAMGVQGQNAKTTYDNQKTLVGQIENWRQSVSGVNMDEELSNMIRFQKAYSSAARVLTAMDEALDKLINGTGVVGR